MRNRDHLKVGQWVQSHYRSRWRGVIEEVRPRKDAEPLLLVKPMVSDKGNLLRKVKSRLLSQHWLVPCDPIN